MSQIHDFACDVDACDHDAAELITTDDGELIVLCQEHYTSVDEFVAINVHGRWLIQDTAGSWSFVPEGAQ